MQKKGVFTFLVCVFVVGVSFYINSTSLFYTFNGKNEVYLNYNSSNAKIIAINKEDIKNFISKKGEAIFIEKKGLCPYKLMEEFSAKLILVEKTNEGVSYYAYFKDIKYVKNVKGEKINLHIFISDKGTKIGSPLIYGSF